VGNALEVIEAIDTLHGGGPDDFVEHCLHVSAQMLLLGKRAENMKSAREMSEAAIADGSAFAKFRELISVQGGDPSYVDDPSRLPKAKLIETVAAPRSGSLSQIHARLVGEAAVSLGAGRAKKSDAIDHAVGIIIHHKVGDIINAGDHLFTIHANDTKLLAQARDAIVKAHLFSDVPVAPLPLFYE